MEIPSGIPDGGKMPIESPQKDPTSFDSDRLLGNSGISISAACSNPDKVLSDGKLACYQAVLLAP